MTPEELKEIEDMTQDAFNKPQHYSEDELNLMPDFRKLVAAIKERDEKRRFGMLCVSTR